MGTVETTTPTASGGKWHGHYPELGTGPLPLEVFTSAEQFALEREHIFRKVWLNVCRIEQLSKPGDFFVKDIGVCNTSVIVVRGKDGQIRAFHNTCLHRGRALTRCYATATGAVAAEFVADALGVSLPPVGGSVDSTVSTGVLYRAISISSLDLRIPEVRPLLERLLDEAAEQRSQGAEEPA